MIRPTGHSTSSAGRDAYDASAGHVCPFCGLTREITADFDPASPCPRCTLSDTPQTRNATKLRVGPWHVRQVRNPWAPGMRFETLLALVKRGQVARDSIVRGPTTFQLWRRAGEIRGLSREFGLCYSCAGELDPQANVCPHCNRSQDPPANPDALIEAREVAPPSATARLAAAPNPDDPPSIDIASSTPRPSATSDPADLLAVTEEPPSAPPAPPVQAPPAPPAQVAPAPVAPAPPAQAKPAAPLPPAAAKPQRPEKPPPRKPAAEPAVEPPSKRPRHEIAAEQGASDEKPAAEKDRPIAIRPRTPGAEDALLTPQELAAAFQLDFSPQGSERRGGSKLAATLLVMLLLAGGAAALFYLRPDFRERAFAWTSRQWTAAKQLVPSRKSPGAPRAPASAPRAAPATRPGSLVMDQPVSPLPATRSKPIAIAPPPAPAPEPQKPEEEPVVEAPPEPVSAPPVASAPASAASPAEPRIVETPAPPRREVTELAQDPPSTAPATEEAVASATAPTEPERVEPTPSPRPAPPVVQSPRPSPPPSPAPAVKKSPDPSEAYAEARRLLGKALDAEENQDYVEAVRCYEAIKRLPVDARAMGIDVRLQRARKLVQ